MPGSHTGFAKVLHDQRVATKVTALLPPKPVALPRQAEKITGNSIPFCKDSSTLSIMGL